MKKERAEDSELFRDAVRDVRPMAPANRVAPARAKPPPVPAKRLEDENAVLDELRSLAGGAAIDTDDIEMEDDAVFLRPGLPRDIVRKLRRTHWVIQDTL